MPSLTSHAARHTRRQGPDGPDNRPFTGHTGRPNNGRSNNAIGRRRPDDAIARCQGRPETRTAFGRPGCLSSRVAVAETKASQKESFQDLPEGRT